VEGRKQATREGGGFWVKTQKSSRGGSVFANAVRGASDPGSGVHIRAVQHQFKDVGGSQSGDARGGGFWVKTQKPSRGGSVFANTVRGASDPGSGVHSQAVQCQYKDVGGSQSGDARGGGF